MPQKSTQRADALCAFVVAAFALTLYIATLQPDLGGPEDTPKFQFLGYVLGTGHPPGYPLYVLLSHVFVQLPIGTIAYRANLFSAVMAALACALTYVLGRQLGAGRVAAVSASAALATGGSFWMNAVFAEVYSLAAVMVVLTIVLSLAWGARGGVGWLLAAVATFSVGLGNHLTIVGIVPAAILYVVIHDRRVLTPRVIALAIMLLCVGVSQYGFIVLRTHQGAPFLESRATTLSELRDVILAKRFASQRFAFSPSALVMTQVPAVASAIRSELGLVGIALLVAGLAGAIAQRRGSAGLVAGAALGSIGMILNLSGDIGGFITPVIPLMWAMAAMGIATIARMLHRVSGFGVRIAATATALTLLLPAARLRANYATAGRHSDAADVRFMREVFRQLPERAGLVTDTYLTVSLLEYLLVTGEAGPARGIVGLDYSGDAVRRASRDGRRVFAFGEAATFMATDGLRFERARTVSSDLGVVYELAGEAPCAQLSADRWTDISPVLATGSWVATFSARGSVAIESELKSSDLRAHTRELLNAGTTRIASSSLGDAGAQRLVTTLTRTHTRRPVFRLALDGIPASAQARLGPGGAVDAVTLCSHAPPSLFAHASEEATIAPDFDLEAYFGAGWSGAERSASGRVRRGSDRATLFLPLDRAYSYQVDFDVSRDPPAPLDVRLNGVALAGCGQDVAVCRVEISSGLDEGGASALMLSPRAVDGSTASSSVLTLRGVRIRRVAATSAR